MEIRRDPDRERQIELPLLMGSPEKLGSGFPSP